jgi:hypothetical protein
VDGRDGRLPITYIMSNIQEGPRIPLLLAFRAKKKAQTRWEELVWAEGRNCSVGLAVTASAVAAASAMVSAATTIGVSAAAGTGRAPCAAAEAARFATATAAIAASSVPATGLAIATRVTAAARLDIAARALVIGRRIARALLDDRRADANRLAAARTEIGHRGLARPALEVPPAAAVGASFR